MSVHLPRNPYSQQPVRWSLIEKWEQLDFVKALPDDIKEKMRKMPAEAEVNYDGYDFIKQEPRMTLIPENSRAYWLEAYNKEYQPIRDTNAKVASLQAKLEWHNSVERSLAHISELLERINQNLARNLTTSEEILSVCCQLEVGCDN